MVVLFFIYEVEYFVCNLIYIELYRCYSVYVIDVVVMILDSWKIFIKIFCWKNLKCINYNLIVYNYLMLYRCFKCKKKIFLDMIKV